MSDMAETSPMPSKVAPPKYQCTRCDYSTNVELFIYDHILKDHGAELVSENYFAAEPPKRKQIVIHDRFGCNSCAYSCDNRTAIEQHVLSHHGDDVE